LLRVCPLGLPMILGARPSEFDTLATPYRTNVYSRVIVITMQMYDTQIFLQCNES
jgi:hypothetical protein